MGECETVHIHLVSGYLSGFGDHIDHNRMTADQGRIVALNLPFGILGIINFQKYKSSIPYATCLIGSVDVMLIRAMVRPTRWVVPSLRKDRITPGAFTLLPYTYIYPLSGSVKRTWSVIGVWADTRVTAIMSRQTFAI